MYGFLCAPNIYHRTKRGVTLEILDSEKRQAEEGKLNIDHEELKVSLKSFNGKFPASIIFMELTI